MLAKIRKYSGEFLSTQIHYRLGGSGESFSRLRIVWAAHDSEKMIKLYLASRYSDCYRIIENMVNFSRFGGCRDISTLFDKCSECFGLARN